MELLELVKRLEVVEGLKVSSPIKNESIGPKSIVIIAGKEAYECLTRKDEGSFSMPMKKLEDMIVTFIPRIRCKEENCRGLFCKDVELYASRSTGVAISGLCPECGKRSMYYLTTSIETKE